MSLLRLLTAGKCLIGGQRTIGRYKFSDPRSMPKFGAGTNPFKPKFQEQQREKVVAKESPKAAVREKQSKPPQVLPWPTTSSRNCPLVMTP